MTSEAQNPVRILVIDDQQANLRLLERLLGRAGYQQVRGVIDPRTARAVFLEFQPDLILLDWQMPHLNGAGVLEQIRPLVPADTFLPVVVLTGDASPESRQLALSSGANDFLTKPFDSTEVMLRIRNLLETRSLHLELRREKELLDHRVRERTAELESARIETIERLARAAEYRDDATGQHARRVGDNSALIAAELGSSPAVVELIRRAAPLHDVGKIGIPDAILLKPGALTAEEFAVIRTHTDIGAQILGGSGSPHLQMAEEIARYHHEHWNGSGYHGMSGEEIPWTGRIVAVVDMFDALVNVRPYKRPWAVEDALDEIRRLSGVQLDPAVVDAFLRVYERTDGFRTNGASVQQ